MPKWLWVIAWSAVLCACIVEPRTNLAQLGHGLEQPWPGSGVVPMTMTFRESGGRPVLHCRLQNLSNSDVALDRSRLPWNQPIYFTGTVVTATGSTFPIGPPAVIASIVGSPAPFALAPKAIVEGDFEPQSLPPNPFVGPPIPRDQDTLLMWSYDLPSYGELPPQKGTPEADRPSHSVKLIGVTFLPKRAMALLAR